MPWQVTVVEEANDGTASKIVVVIDSTAVVNRQKIDDSVFILFPLNERLDSKLVVSEITEIHGSQ